MNGPPEAGGPPDSGAPHDASRPPGVGDANPFASRFIQPGAICYVFTAQEGTDALSDLSGKILRSATGRCAIVGPHGTGKSTLLADLRRRWREAGLRVAEIDAGPSRPPRTLRRNILLCRDLDVLTIDGFERLAVWDRWLVRLVQRRLGCGVAVTLHRELRGYETVYRTRRTAEIEAAVLGELLQDQPAAREELLRSSMWAESRRRHGENLRESLFDAYDWMRERNP